LVSNINLNVVVVTYNNKNLLKKCVNSIERAICNLKFSSIITVIDNASTDGTEFGIDKNSSHIHYVKNKKNFGLAKGLNIGIKQFFDSKFTLLLNDDVELFDNTIKDMIGTLEQYPDAYGIPAALVYPDGSPQRIKLSIMGVNRRIKNSVSYVRFAGTTASMYRTEIFRKIGLFDEFYFFYNEDLDFCLRAKRAGIKFVFNPSIKVIHNKSNRSRTETEIKPYFYATDYYFYRKNYGRVFSAVYRLMAMFHIKFQRRKLMKYNDNKKLELLEQGRSMLLDVIRSFRKKIY